MEKLYKIIVCIFGYIILGGLLLLNIRYTCAMDDIWSVWHEITVFRKDSIALNLVVLFFTLILFVGVRMSLIKRKKKSLSAKQHTLIRCILLFIIAVMGIVWIFSTRLIPRMDQMWVQECLAQVIEGDYSSFEKGGYIFMCPHQTGLMWVSYLLKLIFGEKMLMAFQVLNVLALILFYVALIRISDFLEWDKIVGTLIPVFGILFYPLILYSSFVYGNLWGLALSVLSIERGLRFVRDRKIYNAILAGVYISLAMVFKKNYLIFAIGILIYAIAKGCKKVNRKAFVLFVAIALGTIVGSKWPQIVGAQIVGHKLDPGISSWAYLEMGLQEAETAPGWYSSYCKNLCYEADYDYDRQCEMAKEDLKETIAEFKNDKKRMAQFFLNKTSSQWCNPTFQGVWINQLSETDGVRAAWVDKFLAVEAEPIHTGITNAVVVIILFGAFLYLPLYRKSLFYTDSLIMMIILEGGFVFHFFWEGKCQYTISYFVILIPYAAAGLIKAAEKICDNGNVKKE